MTVTRPEDFHRSYTAAFNSGNVQALLSHYERDATLVPQPNQLASGHEPIRAALQHYMAIWRMTAETRYCITCGGIALASAIWRISGIGPDGQPVEVQGTSGDVLRRQSDGRWLLAVDHPFGGSC
jgi:ketosteroid isomerase-like protein